MDAVDTMDAVDRLKGRVFIKGPSLTPGYFSDAAGDCKRARRSRWLRSQTRLVHGHGAAANQQQEHLHG